VHHGRVSLAGAGIEWPVCTAGDPMCSDVASFDLGVAVAQLRGGLDGFERCYTRGLARRALGNGHVAFKLRLAEDKNQARATSVEVTDQGTVDDMTLTCFEGHLRTLRFDPGASGSIVRLTLLLK
jgi:hypothetical protein